MTCSRLLKTGCNNVVLPTLFIVVNNVVQPESLNQAIVEPESARNQAQQC